MLRVGLSSRLEVEADRRVMFGCQRARIPVGMHAPLKLCPQLALHVKTFAHEQRRPRARVGSEEHRTRAE